MNTSATSQTISSNDLMALGLNDVAYVKPALIEDKPVFSVHAADGTQIAIFADREVAIAAVRRHDMEPLSVH